MLRRKPKPKDKPMEIHCALWNKDELTFEDLKEGLENLEQLNDDSDLIRWVKVCKNCGQLYFYEFKEYENWSTGDSASYRTWIPASSLDEARLINHLAYTQLLNFSSIRLDSDSSPKPYKIIK
jgi:hypothetical protein